MTQKDTKIASKSEAMVNIVMYATGEDIVKTLTLIHVYDIGTS